MRKAIVILTDECMDHGIEYIMNHLNGFKINHYMWIREPEYDYLGKDAEMVLEKWDADTYVFI